MGHDHPLGRPAPSRRATLRRPHQQSGARQAQQFGYNNDYLDIIETNREGTRALLVCNHEYTNEGIMFPPGSDPDEVIRTAWAAHGMSVVELERRSRGRRWSYVKAAGRTGGSPSTRCSPSTARPPGPRCSGPPRTAPARKVRGTMNNCAGGTTPWGTVLSGEENFNQYFTATGTDPREKRYGLAATGDARNWRSRRPALGRLGPGVRQRAEPVRLDRRGRPDRPPSTPVKHTAMGRFKHEGANVVVNGDGHVVAYMGDDERFDYVYRFVSRDTYRPGGRARDRGTT